jgi:hypothetical protein
MTKDNLTLRFTAVNSKTSFLVFKASHSSSENSPQSKLLFFVLKSVVYKQRGSEKTARGLQALHTRLILVF